MYIVYGKQNCAYCTKAKQLLESKNLPYKYIDLGVDISVEIFKELMWEAYQVIPKTVPQILENDQYIGGFDALETYLD